MTQVLRAGVLDGVSLLVAGVAAADGAAAAQGRCAALGAQVNSLVVDPLGEEPSDVDRPGVLVWDGAGACMSGDGMAGVRSALDGAWLAIRAAVALPEPGPQKVILLAPPRGGAHAEAARAGLENLARTLSIEWARFGTRIVAVLGGAPDEVAETVAYLASPAGDYFSGTAIPLG